jgi:O-acetyl-ADP-ribose deacetylase (regulator of RNase III)
MPIHKTFTCFAGRTVQISINDLVYEAVDAIVNAANGGLVPGGGVAGDIYQAAGDAYWNDCKRYVRAHGRVPTGEAVVTCAGALPFKGIINAVGPRLGEGDEEAKLTLTIANALLRGHERGWRSIAFPAISSGIYAVEYPVCARAYAAGIARHFRSVPDSTLRLVKITLFLGDLVDLVSRECERVVAGT